MEQMGTPEDVFDLGTWVGRRQAFALVTGRCSAADAEILFEIRDKKLFRSMENTWEDFCCKRLGMARSYADRLIRQFQQLGPNFCKLNSFTRIRPADYRLIAPALTDDGLSYDGEVIPLEPGNAPKLVQAVEALRRDSAVEETPRDVANQSLAKVDRTLRSAVADLRRLQAMELDDEHRMELLIIVVSCCDELNQIRLSTCA
jgi:hypothetical protein